MLVFKQSRSASSVGHRGASKAHSLLELIVATGIFVMVSVALSGVWVMYGRSLAKSAEVLAAGSIARSAAEGMVANGWDWLREQGTEDPADLNYPVEVERTVRGRSANIHYDVLYTLSFNDTGAVMAVIPSRDICALTIFVRWHSANGSKVIPGTEFNNEAVYSSLFYRHGI